MPWVCSRSAACRWSSYTAAEATIYDHAIAHLANCTGEFANVYTQLSAVCNQRILQHVRRQRRLRQEREVAAFMFELQRVHGSQEQT